MQNAIAEIKRLGMETRLSLQNIANRIQAAEKLIVEASPNVMSELDTNKVRKFEQFLNTINIALNEHMQSEEEKIMPIVSIYAEEIVGRGLITEHKVILRYITELSEKARDFTNDSTDKALLEKKKAEIIETLQSICMLIEEHVRKQEVIYDLARLAQDSIEVDNKQTT